MNILNDLSFDLVDFFHHRIISIRPCGICTRELEERQMAALKKAQHLGGLNISKDFKEIKPHSGLGFEPG